MADWNSMVSKGSGFGEGSNEEFEEGDVWGVVKDRNSCPNQEIYSSGSSSAWRLPTAPRAIRRAGNSPTTHEGKVVQKSAPLNIPDWSRIYGKSADADNGHVKFEEEEEEEEEEGDDDDYGMVPPHEWMARKLARSQISSFSVCEGIGRTLKGRDLSRVRNDILTKTGFLEQ